MKPPNEILVVDDSPIVLKLLREMLSNEDFQVRSAEHGEPALRSVAARPPGLILLDIDMPGMNGFEVCHRLKEQEESREIPVIFLSGLKGIEEKVKGFGLGAVDFISKPFQREELLARVHTHLELSRLRNRLETEVAEKKAELSKATEAIIGERDFSNAILNNLPGIFYLFHRTGKCLRWNKNLENITGYSPEEIGEMEPRDFFAGPDRTLIRKKTQEAFDRGFSDGEAELVSKNKKKAPYYFTWQKVQREGKPCLIGMGLDISEGKRIEENLRKSEERYRNILETIEDGYYEVDLAGNFSFINDAVTKIFGYSKDDLLGMNNRTYTDSGNSKILYKAFNQVYRTGEPCQAFEHEIVTRDRTKKTLETSVSLIRNEAGEPAGFRGIIRDITRLRRAEKALLKSEERFRVVAESTNDFIFEEDFKTGRLEWFGKAVEKLKDLLGEIPYTEKAYEKMIHPEDHDRVIEAIKRHMRSQAPFRQEYRLIGKDGNILFLLSQGICLWNEKGKPSKWIGSLSDITERKKKEEELRQSLDKLHKAMGGIIQAMAQTVESRDSYTAGHQRRVANLARSIGQEMGLTQDQVESIRVAGIVHDVGKISLPAEILSKPTQLSALEFSLIKVHPQTSYDILKDIDFPWPIARIVLQHHERINGSGYPFGLKDEEILLEAKVLMVADVVEAMASHRPYRAALGIDRALEEISKNRGILYNPEVVDVCLSLFREKGFKFN